MSGARSAPPSHTTVPDSGNVLSSHDSQGSIWEPSPQDLVARDLDHGLLAGVHGVEMRRVVIGEVHPDHDPLEATDRRPDDIIDLSDSHAALEHDATGAP